MNGTLKHAQHATQTQRDTDTQTYRHTVAERERERERDAHAPLYTDTSKYTHLYKIIITTEHKPTARDETTTRTKAWSNERG